MRMVALVWLVAACSGGHATPDARVDARPCQVDTDCDDADPCTIDRCIVGTGCRHIDPASCGTPFCQLSGCGVADSDGDGLADAWEMAGGIDLNCDGELQPAEKVLTNFDPLLLDGVTPNPHPSAEVGRKDVFVRYDFMAVDGSGAACTTASDCGGHCTDNWAACGSTADCGPGATCASDQYCVGHCSATPSLACNSAFDCGGTCSISTTQHCTVDADCPGHCSITADQVCMANADCPAGETCGDAETCTFGGETCVETVCTGHSDAPTAAALQMVVDAFAAKGITLHIAPSSNHVAHAHVTSYGPPLDGCATPAGHVNDAGRAADFYSYQVAMPDQHPFIHRALFAHLHTCDSPADCATCPVNDQGYTPKFRESGLSEIVGNDMIIALGATSDGNGGRARMSDLAIAGTFMHELGHNLGLDHGGPIGHPDHALNYKPNYLSVMNYSFQKTGIETASATCAPDDNLCRTTPVSARVDFSSAALPALDEHHLDETVGIASGTHDITRYFCPDETRGAGSGPINWDCATDGPVKTDAPGNGSFLDIDNSGTADSSIMGADDWDELNYSFQCNASHYLSGAP